MSTDFFVRYINACVQDFLFGIIRGKMFHFRLSSVLSATFDILFLIELLGFSWRRKGPEQLFVEGGQEDLDSYPGPYKLCDAGKVTSTL